MIEWSGPVGALLPPPPSPPSQPDTRSWWRRLGSKPPNEGGPRGRRAAPPRSLKKPAPETYHDPLPLPEAPSRRQFVSQFFEAARTDIDPLKKISVQLSGDSLTGHRIRDEVRGAQRLHVYQLEWLRLRFTLADGRTVRLRLQERLRVKGKRRRGQFRWRWSLEGELAPNFALQVRTVGSTRWFWLANADERGVEFRAHELRPVRVIASLGLLLQALKEGRPPLAQAELDQRIRTRAVPTVVDRLPFLDGALEPAFPPRKPEPLVQGWSIGRPTHLRWGGELLAYESWPERRRHPTFHETPLNWLSAQVEQACICKIDDWQQACWLGKNAFQATETWSSSKFVPALCAMVRSCEKRSQVNFERAFLAGPDPTQGYRYPWQDLLDDIVSYRAGDDDSNKKASTIKNLSSEKVLLEFIDSQCGPQRDLQFGRNYGNFAGLLECPRLYDKERHKLLEVTKPVTRGGSNLLNGYVLVKLLCQLVMQPRLNAQQGFKKIAGIETLLDALRLDPAVYLEAAFEALDLSPQNLRVFSKMGMGPGLEERPNQLCYLAFCDFALNGKPQRFCLFLKVGEATADGDLNQRLQALDLLMAQQVARIVQLLTP